MRKNLLTIFLCLFSFIGFSQIKNDTITSKYNSTIFKLNISSLFLKTVGLQYETKINNKSSFCLGFMFRPNSNIKLFSFGTNSNMYTANSYKTLDMSLLSITPEIKIYIKKEAMKGFYIAPFIRYNNSKSTFNIDYFASKIDSTRLTYKKATLKENMFGVGALIGYQIISSNNIVVDFWFAGPWIGNSNSNLTANINVDEITTDDKNFISNNIEPMIKNNKILWDNNGINTDIKKLTYGFRTCGFNIGIRF